MLGHRKGRRSSKSASRVFYLIIGSVITLTLLAFALIYTVTYQGMRDTIRRIHMAEMAQLLQSSERAYASYTSMLSQILTNSAVREYSYNPVSSAPGERYATRTLRQELMSTLMLNTDVKFVYIWYPETNVVVGSNARLMSAEEWLAEMTAGSLDNADAYRLLAPELEGVAQFLYRDPQSNMLYLVLGGQSMGTGYATSTARVFLFIDIRYLLSNTGSLSRDATYSALWLMNDAGEALLQMGGEPFRDDVRVSGGMAEADGIVYLQQRSGITGFTYRAAYPESAYYAPLHTTSTLLWTISGLSLAFTLLALVRYAIWHFGKLRRLSRMAAPYADAQARVAPPRDEVDVIGHALYDVLGRNNALSHRLLSHQSIARAAYLGKVLAGTLHLRWDDLERVNADMGMQLCDGWFAVAIVLDEREGAEGMQALSSVALEAFSQEQYAVYEAYIPDGMGLICNFTSQRQAEEALDALADRLLSAIASLDIATEDVNVAIGNAHEGVESLPEAYREAREALEGRFFLPGGVLRYRDMLSQRKSRFISYPLAVEQKLLNRLVCGDAVGALELLEQVWIENPLATRESGKEERALLGSELKATLMKAAMELAARDGCGQEAQLSHKLRFSSYEALRESVAAAVKELCAASQESEKSRHGIADEVYDYIRMHYADPDLNITRLGEFFHFSPFYLSRVFKNDTGITVTDAIARERMQRADQLLRESDMGITQISVMVGYQEYSTFARAFKQYSGVAPSRVRQEK